MHGHVLLETETLTVRINGSNKLHVVHLGLPTVLVFLKENVEIIIRDVNLHCRQKTAKVRARNSSKITKELQNL